MRISIDNKEINKDLPTIFVGYDDREADAYNICVHSLLKNSSTKLINIVPLKHKELRDIGLFSREWRIDGETGRYVCVVDKRNFSTQFSHTRFLVPELYRTLGLTHPLAMFVDCDFVFTGDIIELFETVRDQDFPLFCVKHDYTPVKEVKMDNCEQARYNRKLWTSLMIFNMKNTRVNLFEALSKEYVNSADGRDLHTFKWLGSSEDDIDTKIGNIPESWNFIPGHSDGKNLSIRAIHYTEGVPHMDGFTFADYSDIYWNGWKTALKEQLKVCDLLIDASEFVKNKSSKK